MIPILLTAATTPTVSGVLSDMASVVTQIMSWASDVGSMIVSTPLLLIFVGGFAAAGIGVGLIKRMISV